MGTAGSQPQCSSRHRPAGACGVRAVSLAALAFVTTLLVQLELPMAGELQWVPALGISLAWRIDGLAALMLLMITGVRSAVFVYAGGYFEVHPGQRCMSSPHCSCCDDRLRHGTSSISLNVERLPATAPSPLLTAGVLLVMVGAFT